MIKHYRHLLLAFLLLCNIAIVQAQNITLNLKNVTVKEAIEAVKEQTGKSFFFNVNDVDLNRRVNIVLKEASLGDALSQILQGQNIGYEVKENHIVLTKKITKKADPFIRISGQVTDESGVPLIGVNISVKDGANTVTDIDGNYSIQAAPGTTLTFSYIGFLSQKVKVNDQRNINIQLVEDTKALNEVVVIGYGTQKKANLTGAVDAISSKEIEDRPVATLGRALQGAVPNLNISYGSGRPNEGTSINIRGFGSINEEAKPLVLIDGVEGDLDNINPRDVESISVLKDASSAAIYGARASFGVILVTTKKGETGDAKVNYNGRFSFSGSTVCTDFITTGYDAAMLVDEFFRSYNGTTYTKYTAEDYAELEARRYDKVENPDRPWTVVKNIGGIDQYMYYANFDWYNYLISHTRPTWDNNVSISGGTKKMNYFISANYHTEEGIYKQNPDHFNTANLRARISGDIKDWFNLTVTTHLYHSQYKAPGLENGDNIPNYTFHALPFMMPYNPDGSWVFSNAVIAQQPTDGVHIMTGDGTTFTNDKNKRLTTTVNAIFKFYKGLTFHANYSFRYDTQDKVVRTSMAEYSTEPGVIVSTGSANLFKNKLRQHSNSEYYHMIDAYLNYDNTFNGHHVRGVLGFDYEQDYQKNLYSYMLNLQSNELNDFNLGDPSKDVYLEGGQYEWALESFFGRVGYDWKGRYLAEVNMRWDASSRFRRDKRAALFPSVSAGWRVSEEPFFAPIRNTFSNFKIRGSYGSLGNQAISSPYPYIQTLNLVQMDNYLANGEFLTYASVSPPTSGNFTWETVIHKNIGVDLGFFNNRLSFTGDMYIRDTKDMLVPGKTLPATYGTSSPQENAADLRTKGYELTISWNDKFNLAGKPFTYGVSFSLGDNISKITKYDNPTKDFNVSSYYEGMTIGEIWGYTIDGLFQSDEEAAAYQAQVDHSLIAKNILQTAVGEYKGLKAGDPRFVDLDGNGRIDDGAKTADNRGDMRIIGNSRPRYNYSGNINFGWLGFDFSAFFQGIGRQQIYPGTDAMLFWGGFARPYSSFTPIDFLDNVWSEDNPDAYFPKIRGYAAQGDRHLAYVNNRYLQNLAYCRLKNVTFGYTLPQSLTQKAKIDRVRVYFSGDNLLTWTALKSKYIDPEQFSNDRNARVYPYAKTFSFGIDITF